MYVLRQVVLVPLLYGNEVAFCIAGRSSRGIEGGAIFCVGGKAISHLVVYFQDADFGAVFAKILFVFAFNDGERFHYVFYGITRSGKIGQKFLAPLGLPIGLGTQVKMKIEGIQFTTDFKSTFLIPNKGRSIIATVLCKRM